MLSGSSIAPRPNHFPPLLLSRGLCPSRLLRKQGPGVGITPESRKDTMKKHKAPQNEIAWDKPEPFALVPEQATDWERVQAEAKARQKDQAESQSKQLPIVLDDWELPMEQKIGEACSGGEAF